MFIRGGEGHLEIIGIGIDSASIERIQRSMQKESFVNKVFSSAEQEYFKSKGELKAAESAAAMFAAKEAFLKAIGKGLGGCALNEITVLHKESGEPYYEFGGKTEEYCQTHRIRAMLSLTHECGVATAMVLLQSAPPARTLF